MAEPPPVDSNLVTADGSPLMPSPGESKPSAWRARLHHKFSVVHQWLSEPTNVALGGSSVGARIGLLAQLP